MALVVGSIPSASQTAKAAAAATGAAQAPVVGMASWTTLTTQGVAFAWASAYLTP